MGVKKLSKTECRCPKCKCIHYATIKWGWTGGDFLPPIYCDICKNIVSSSEQNIEEHRVTSYFTQKIMNDV